MRVKARLDMPIEDFILLHKLAKKGKCNIGTFIRRVLANYINDHWTVDQLEKIMGKPLSEKEWNLIAKINIHKD